jgi:5-methyltetrahydrofolate--homocysteine methyltransferase
LKIQTLSENFSANTLEAGSEIILANTFSANRPSMKGTGYTVEQIVTRAMEIAHETIDR